MLNNDITWIMFSPDWDGTPPWSPAEGIGLLNPSYKVEELSHTKVYEAGIPSVTLWLAGVSEDCDGEELLQTGIYSKITRDNTASQIMCMRIDESTGTFVSDLNTPKFNGYEFNLCHPNNAPCLLCTDPTVQITSLTKGVVWMKESIPAGSTTTISREPYGFLPPSMWKEDNTPRSRPLVMTTTPDYYPLKAFFKKLADEINFNNERYSSHMFRAGCPAVSGVKHISWKDIEAFILNNGLLKYQHAYMTWDIHRYKRTYPDGYIQYETKKTLNLSYPT